MKNITHGGDIYTKYNTDSERIIDFSANINPLGMPGSVKEAIISNIDNYTAYPDPLCRELRKGLSNYHSINKDYILCSNGAAEIIYKIVLALKPAKAMVLAPTFSEYESALKMVGAEINYYVLNEENDFKIENDILDHIKPHLDIVLICNPNNPTGIPLAREKMIQMLDKCKKNNTLLVVDECFTDFLIDEEEYSIIDMIESYDNLIILKAFTKIFAMAGIRLGYMLCSNNIINDKIDNALQPWSVSTVAIKAGTAALKEKEYVLETKRYVKENREYLIDELKKAGFTVFESKANYIFFKSNSDDLDKKLVQYGILIRSCKNYRGLSKNYYRIAVKNRKDNQYLIKCLNSIYNL